MSWFSSVFSGLAKWWRRNNSGGDVIRNNKALVRRTVTAVVSEVWKLKASGEVGVIGRILSLGEIMAMSRWLSVQSGGIY